jgi:SAM-dependent methyltransferase
MLDRKAVYRQWVAISRKVRGIPQPGAVDFGDLRRVNPISRHFGVDRGTAVDRHYVESFLARHAADVRGRVLEVCESTYTRRYGGDRVTHCDVLHVRDGNPQATIIADLADAPQVPDASFDCIVLTQTLHLVYDAGAAVRTLHRLLKPGGVLLLTVPGITQVPHGTDWAYTWYWAFTELSVRKMLGEVFGAGNLAVEVGGNVLAATALLHGLAVEEFAADELDALDRDYPVIIAARALRAV